MSANGLDVFDKTLQTTHIWLDEVMAAIGPNRKVAWKVLSTVLHKLRDRTPVDLAAHLGSQLPLLIRGVYYDQFQPARQPTACRNYEEFCDEVGEWLRDTRPVDPDLAVRTVFRVLSRHIPEGQISKVQDSLPRDIRQVWRAIAAEVEHPPAQGRPEARRPAGGEAAREVRAM
ncbi:MAG: DUF2267 domain-containing protein [Phenylobacterium sp.]|jgi:uncharacterized protein (DUF2267 family)|uniref:DUF2267 domain-containing protein n=1 Tax=Phenylobacterium sp. TaxID=1871053 RepID=UPI002A2B0B7E|nr:DUF2267 domain-containing protein [Phenylobacterium sp.]